MMSLYVVVVFYVFFAFLFCSVLSFCFFPYVSVYTYLYIYDVSCTWHIQTPPGNPAIQLARQRLQALGQRGAIGPAAQPLTPMSWYAIFGAEFGDIWWCCCPKCHGDHYLSLSYIIIICLKEGRFFWGSPVSQNLNPCGPLPIESTRIFSLDWS